MPRINLKPKSPEFDEPGTNAKQEICNMPGCRDSGIYKAPKNRGLRDYYHFCLDHVREYNRAWNFFSGMSKQEMEDHMTRSLYGDRPTWRYDAASASEDTLRRKVWQSYHFTDEEPPQDPRAGAADNKEKRFEYEKWRNTPEFDAMALMGLRPPLTMEDIKSRYKALAKKYHPDLNKGCKKSENLLKRINMAYTILKLAHEHFEDLEE